MNVTEAIIKNNNNNSKNNKKTNINTARMVKIPNETRRRRCPTRNARRCAFWGFKKKKYIYRICVCISVYIYMYINIYI